MMKSTHSRTSSTLTFILLAIAWTTGTAMVHAQAAMRFVGSVTAVSGNTLTVKTDAGDQRQVEISSETSLKRIAPGEKDLSKAVPISSTDLSVGDRVLVKLDPDAAGATPKAAQIIAVKQEDLAQKQQKDREAWQRQGVAGLVKSVDASSGTVMLTTGAGATAKTVTVNTSKSTILKRYAPGSVRFDEAKPAPIEAIQAGDQLRARGQKSADGSSIAAEEIVSGSFRNISGTISSVDAAGSTLVVKDLATKKQMTVHITPQAQMRRIPDRMAQMLATRLKGGEAAGGAGQGGRGGPVSGNAAPSTAPQPPTGGSQEHHGDGKGPGSGGGGEGPGQNGGGDPQQMLSRAPTIQLADLQKGEAVMLVSTEGANEVTAITLLAGVEPLLQAPAASQNLLSNWSMGSGGAEGAGAQ